METEYKNSFQDEILNNKVLMKKLSKSFQKMKDKNYLKTNDGEYKGYFYEDKESGLFYLLVEDKEMTTIYQTTKNSYSKPFEKFFQGDVESLKYYADKVMSVFNSKEILKEKEIELEERLSFYPLEKRERMKKFLSDDILSEYVDSNPYLLKSFMLFLENNNFADSFDKDCLYKNSKLYEVIKTRIPEFSTIFEAMKDTLKSNGFTEKNKYVYNDLDNRIWKNANYIISTTQNFDWVIDFKDKKNFVVYSALESQNGCGSKSQTLNSLLKNIKSGDELDNIDFVNLKVQNGKVIYANNAFMTSLDFNILLNKDVLESDGLLKITYDDVDVKSFEYQFAYSNTKYKTSKLDFLIHSLFILANGFCYDQENGRLYSDVKYIPNLLENFNYKESKEEKDNKLTSLIYIAPKKLDYLDDQWLDGLKYLLDKIKQDKPNLSDTHTNYGTTVKETLQELTEVVKRNEQLRQVKLKL